jgi:hypothetical protein
MIFMAALHGPSLWFIFVLPLDAPGMQGVLAAMGTQLSYDTLNAGLQRTVVAAGRKFSYSAPIPS